MIVLFLTHSNKTMFKSIASIDKTIISTCQNHQYWFARVAVFILYFWFGILKVLGLSPANPLVQNLMEKTLPFMTFSTFIILFGLFEMLIGILFLIPRLERVVIPLLAFHMATTVMPLVLLPTVAWSGFMVPTMEGQYIIKNILIIAVAIGIAARITPMKAAEQKA